MELDVQMETSAAQVILRVAGRLTAGESLMCLRERIDPLFDRGFERIVVELSRVSYLDSAGLGELLRARAHALEHGTALVVREPSTQVASLLRLTGLDAVLRGPAQAPGAPSAAEKG
jgi:anti-anti-sigma factor